MIDLQSTFMDGTKTEANANKYSFAWKKSTQIYKARLQEKVKALLEQTDELEAEEELEYGDHGMKGKKLTVKS